MVKKTLNILAALKGGFHIILLWVKSAFEDYPQFLEWAGEKRRQSFIFRQRILSLIVSWP
jgi:hypothetical protein